MKIKLMAHLVAGYPTLEESKQTALGIAEGGADYLEIQLPFSDPTADGPTIQQACQTALENGFKVEQGFKLVEEVSKETGLPIYIMSYANIVYVYGVPEFCRKAKECGASGLIIPDLTPGSDEGLYEEGRKAGLNVVPVVAPSTTGDRLEQILRMKPTFLYAALRDGITGKTTELSESGLSLIDRVAQAGETKILGGFGINSPEQIRTLEGKVHAAVVGSALCRVVAENCGKANLKRALKEKVEFLLGR